MTPITIFKILICLILSVTEANLLFAQINRDRTIRPGTVRQKKDPPLLIQVHNPNETLYPANDPVIIKPQLSPQTKRPNQTGIVNLDSLRWRDMCVLPDPVSKTYYIVGPGGRSVRCYTSKDLKDWEGPEMEDIGETLRVVKEFTGN